MFSWSSLEQDILFLGEKPFECDQCEKGFTRKDKLKQHIAKHHIDMLSGQLFSQEWSTYR